MAVFPVTFTATEFVAMPDNATKLEVEKEMRDIYYCKRLAGMLVNVKVEEPLKSEKKAQD